MGAVEAALAAIDAAHEGDPTHAADGRAAELVYAERVSAWVSRLAPDASEALRLAARAQHFERWVIPRSDHPEGRSGYFAWRRAVQRRQRERVEAVLRAAGVDGGMAMRVGVLVGKATRSDDAEGRVLEDAACLVFFAHELESFMRAHPEIASEKLDDIAAKTWAKMSPAGRAMVRAEVVTPEVVAAVVRRLA